MPYASIGDLRPRPAILPQRNERRCCLAWLYNTHNQVERLWARLTRYPPFDAEPQARSAIAFGGSPITPERDRRCGVCQSHRRLNATPASGEREDDRNCSSDRRHCASTTLHGRTRFPRKWWGSHLGDTLRLCVGGKRAVMAINFSIERKGRKFSARADGKAPFFVGYQTQYTDKSSKEDFEGLYNVPSRELPELVYDATQGREVHGFWADFIVPTALCEGGNFLTLNTYDRARFTWGFGQFGAHVPDGDFIHFFRDMLGRPEAPDYFPNLVVNDGRISKMTGGRSEPLEDKHSTLPLMNFLNPSTAALEDAEVVAAAKLIHWTTEEAGARELQVLHMTGVFKRLMKEADMRLGLDGLGADVCCVVCDIRHQGRAKYTAMQTALQAKRPLEELLKLGSIAYPERIKTLRAALADAGAIFVGKRFSRSTGEFS